jgi:ferredoxin
VTPHYYLMDAIMGMEGQGPGTAGTPFAIGLLIGSTNPLALDIIACQIAGYKPILLPTNKIALERKKWLTSEEEIIYDGPELKSLIKDDFVRIPASASRNTALRFIMGRVSFLRKLERRPVFLRSECTGCHKCTKICPVEAIKPSPSDSKRIVLTDKKCIRCFCCAEVCQDDAIDVRVKLFGV